MKRSKEWGLKWDASGAWRNPKRIRIVSSRADLDVAVDDLLLYARENPGQWGVVYVPSDTAPLWKIVGRIEGGKEKRFRPAGVYEGWATVGAKKGDLDRFYIRYKNTSVTPARLFK